MSFRNSSLADWSLPEVDGYFVNRTPSERSDSSGSRDHRKSLSGFITATQHNFTVLSKNVRKEEIKLKLKRLFLPVIIGLGLQVTFLMIFSCLFPGPFWDPDSAGVYYYLGFNYVYNVGSTVIQSLFSCHALKLTLLTFAMMFLTATCLYPSDHFPETIQERISRYSTPRFLIKPLSFTLVSLMHCNIFLNMFDSYYYPIELEIPVTTGDEETIFRGDFLVLRLTACISGALFFVRNFFNNGFCLTFPTIRVKSILNTMLDSLDFSNIVKGSMLLAFVVWICCLLLSPLFYSPLSHIFNLKVYAEEFIGRLVLFLNLSFLIRAFLWTCISRLSMTCYLSLVNTCLTEIINLPIEQPPNNNQCMILSEAMKCDNIYIKHLAFFEFRLKADESNPDVMVFFNITHPGNHPINWKGIFTATCDVFTTTTTSIIKFLKTVNIPANTLQLNLQPYVLTRLREESQNQSASDDVAKLPEGHRPRYFRNLATPDGPVAVMPDVPREVNHISELPAVLWADLRHYITDFFSVQTLNNLLFMGKLDHKIPENQVANLMADLKLLNWGLGGSAKLISIGLLVDKRGIFHQDIKTFLETLLDIHDTLNALDFYFCVTLEKEQGINRIAFIKFKQQLGRTITSTNFVLTNLHDALEECYNILNLSEDCQLRLAEIASANRN